VKKTKRNENREKAEKRVTFDAPADLFLEVSEYAEREDVSVASVCRKALRVYMSHVVSK